MVVPLASVNSFHHWLVIRRCSCMFDFSSHIRMLELVLCSGRDGAQDPRFLYFIIQAAILWIIMISYMTHWLDGCDHTWVYLSILTGWLCHALDLDYCILCYGWLCPYRIYIMYLRYQLYFSMQVFQWRCFSVEHVLVKHFTPLSLLGLML